MKSQVIKLRAFTLSELLLAYAVLALILGLMVGLGGFIQREAKARLASDMVLVLREALVVYHAETGDYPPAGPQKSAEQVIQAMLGAEGSREVLLGWPLDLHANVTTADFVDPWGLPFRYLTADSKVRDHRDRVLVDGVPIFESAGADMKFGDDAAAFCEDNIASDTAKMLSGR